MISILSEDGRAAQQRLIVPFDFPSKS